MTSDIVRARPQAAVVMALGHGYDGEREFSALVLQKLDYVDNRNGGLLPDAGMLSLWEETVKDGRDLGSNEDERVLSAALSCANFQFWNGAKPLGVNDLMPVAGPVEAGGRVATLFLLRRRLQVADTLAREGLAAVPLELAKLPAYLSHHVLTDDALDMLGVFSKRYSDLVRRPMDVTTALQQVWQNLPALPPSRISLSPQELRLVQLARQHNPALTTQMADLLAKPGNDGHEL